MRILGIDSSTKSIAYCLITDGKYEASGKFEFTSSGYTHLGQAVDHARMLFQEYEPDYVVIEGSAYINNMNVMKKLSMVQGAILGGFLALGGEVSEVPPVTWQSGIGNPPSNKTLRARFNRKYPELSKSAQKKKIREYRKQRTMDIIKDTIGLETYDDDIADAAGVALYTHMGADDG